MLVRRRSPAQPLPGRLRARATGSSPQLPANVTPGGDGSSGGVPGTHVGDPNGVPGS